MKKASWILSYIGSATYSLMLVFFLIGGILCIIEGMNGTMPGGVESGIANIIVSAICAPLIWFCLYFAKKVRNAKTKKEIEALSIVALFLIGILPGLFALVSDEKDYPGYYSDPNSLETDSFEAKLKNLIKLREQGLLTEEEFLEAKKKLIEKV